MSEGILLVRCVFLAIENGKSSLSSYSWLLNFQFSILLTKSRNNPIEYLIFSFLISKWKGKYLYSFFQKFVTQDWNHYTTFSNCTCTKKEFFRLFRKYIKNIFDYIKNDFKKIFLSLLTVTAKKSTATSRHCRLPQFVFAKLPLWHKVQSNPNLRHITSKKTCSNYWKIFKKIKCKCHYTANEIIWKQITFN